ncbi:MAG: hypothetical protein FJ276_35355 [Planctomycetes bacterium]|nr:hypothetical protein [Planctomycetota bacterium]
MCASRASTCPRELVVRLLRARAAHVLVAVPVLLSIHAANRADSAEIDRAPNIVLMLADDKY